MACFQSRQEQDLEAAVALQNDVENAESGATDCFATCARLHPAKPISKYPGHQQMLDRVKWQVYLGKRSLSCFWFSGTLEYDPHDNHEIIMSEANFDSL